MWQRIRPRHFAQTFGTPDAIVRGSSGEMAGDFNGDGRLDLMLYGESNSATPSGAMKLQVFTSNRDVETFAEWRCSYIILPMQSSDAVPYRQPRRVLASNRWGR